MPPEAEMTPGRACYDAHRANLGYLPSSKWEALPDNDKACWERIAQATIAAAPRSSDAVGAATPGGDHENPHEPPKCRLGYGRYGKVRRVHNGCQPRENGRLGKTLPLVEVDDGRTCAIIAQ